MATDVTTSGGNGDGSGHGPGIRVQRRFPGTEARAGKFPGPSLIPALEAIQRDAHAPGSERHRVCELGGC